MLTVAQPKTEAAGALDRLRARVKQSIGPTPLLLLSARCMRASVDPGGCNSWATLVDAHAGLIEGVAGDAAAADHCAAAYTQLQQHCSSHVLRATNAIVASVEAQDLPTTERRAQLLRKLDQQVRLRLALAAIALGAGVGSDPVSGKAYKELKRLVQLLGLKLAFQPSLAVGDGEGNEAPGLSRSAGDSSSRVGDSAPASLTGNAHTSGSTSSSARVITLPAGSYLGVNVGTAFCISKECIWPDTFKDRVLASDETDTYLSLRPLKNSSRIFKNGTAEALAEIERANW